MSTSGWLPTAAAAPVKRQAMCRDNLQHLQRIFCGIRALIVKRKTDLLYQSRFGCCYAGRVQLKAAITTNFFTFIQQGQ